MNYLPVSAFNPVQASAKVVSRLLSLNPQEMRVSSQSKIAGEILLDDIAKGMLRADEVEHQRRGGELVKVLRLRRFDGEEFAIQIDGKSSILVWSSKKPDGRFPGVVSIKRYGASDTRHHNLGCMPRLRGPDPSTGVDGVQAWLVEFKTAWSAAHFVRAC